MFSFISYLAEQSIVFFVCSRREESVAESIDFMVYLYVSNRFYVFLFVKPEFFSLLACAVFDGLLQNSNKFGLYCARFALSLQVLRAFRGIAGLGRCGRARA